MYYWVLLPSTNWQKTDNAIPSRQTHSCRRHEYAGYRLESSAPKTTHPRSIAPVRILGCSCRNEYAAEALSHKLQEIDIFSNSWANKNAFLEIGSAMKDVFENGIKIVRVIKVENEYVLNIILSVLSCVCPLKAYILICYLILDFILFRMHYDCFI